MAGPNFDSDDVFVGQVAILRSGTVRINEEQGERVELDKNFVHFSNSTGDSDGSYGNTGINFNYAGAHRISVSAARSWVLLNRADATPGAVLSGMGGTLDLHGRGGSAGIKLDGEHRAIIVFNRGTSTAFFEVDGEAGAVRLKDTTAHSRIDMDPERARVSFPRRDRSEAIRLDGNETSITLRASRPSQQNIFGGPAAVKCFTGNGYEAAYLGTDGLRANGNSYVVRFPVVNQALASAIGTVMVTDADGGPLRACDSLADKRVIGVVTLGWGDSVLTRGLPADAAHVAVAGVVHCNVDATSIPIEAGDPLITSQTPGHAQGVPGSVPSANSAGFGTLGGTAQRIHIQNGCMLGKALAPLSSGRGLIPVLVALG